MNKQTLMEKYPWLKAAPTVANGIIETLFKKEEHYAGSWQKRGGIGAFMMMCRKWDRIEKIAAENGYNIFKVLEDNDADTIDDVDDLIGYLLMIRGKVMAPVEAPAPAEMPAPNEPTYVLQLPWLGVAPGPHSERGPVTVTVSNRDANMLLRLCIVKVHHGNILTPVVAPQKVDYQ
jgi:hypothetical protein